MQDCSSYFKCWYKNYFLSIYLSSPNLKSFSFLSPKEQSVNLRKTLTKIQLQLFNLFPYYNIYQEMPSCHSPDSFSPETQIQSQWVTVHLWTGVALVQRYVSGLIYTASCQSTLAAHLSNLPLPPHTYTTWLYSHWTRPIFNLSVSKVEACAVKPCMRSNVNSAWHVILLCYTFIFNKLLLSSVCYLSSWSLSYFL